MEQRNKIYGILTKVLTSWFVRIFKQRTCQQDLLKQSGVRKWGNLDLNQGPTGYESAALTTELLPHKNLRIYRNPLQESTPRSPKRAFLASEGGSQESFASGLGFFV